MELFIVFKLLSLTGELVMQILILKECVEIDRELKSKKHKKTNQSTPEKKELTEMQVDDWVEEFIDRCMTAIEKDNCQ